MFNKTSPKILHIKAVTEMIWTKNLNTQHMRQSFKSKIFLIQLW